MGIIDQGPAMGESRDDFYESVLARFVSQGILSPTEHAVLVVAGGDHDFQACLRQGFKKVTISNLDERMTATEYAPYSWSFEDGENLTLPDGSVDFCIVHNGLHHCASPHKALLEMLRVARRGVLLFEPYDNVVTRMGVRLGIGQDFEHAAVYYNDCRFGGFRNTPVPNYIYRFTRQELRKTVMCGAPWGPCQFHFIHELRIPWVQLKGRKNKLYFLAVLACLPFLKLATLVAPSFANCFAALILKPELPAGLYPWLERNSDGNVVANREWLAA